MSRPGTASSLIPKLGIAQEWITSAEVIIARISVIVGNTARGAASNKRSCPVKRVSVGTIKESKVREPDECGYS